MVLTASKECSWLPWLSPGWSGWFGAGASMKFGTQAKSNTRSSQKTLVAAGWANSVLVGCSTAPTSTERLRQKQRANRPMMYFINYKGLVKK